VQRGKFKEIIGQLEAGGRYKVYGQREYAADGTLF